MSVGGAVIDDHLLLQVLLDDEPPDLRPDGGRISTTGRWYHRLCRALVNPTIAGAMSKSLGNADPELGTAAVQAATALPTAIGLTSLRQLAWPMARLLDVGVRLNLMSLEALAAAEQLGAEICLAEADENKPLIDAARQRGISIRSLRS